MKQQQLDNANVLSSQIITCECNIKRLTEPANVPLEISVKGHGEIIIPADHKLAIVKMLIVKEKVRLKKLQAEFEKL